MDDNIKLSDLEFLKRGILLGDRFQLYFVIANTVDDRKNIIDDLSSTDGLSVEVIEGSSVNKQTFVGSINDAFLHLQSGNSQGRPVIVLSNIDELVSEEPRLINKLNEERNELIAQTPGAIIFLGNKGLIERVRSQAPDAWSVRSADLDISEEAGNIYTSSAYIPTIEGPKLIPILPPRGDDERKQLEQKLKVLPVSDERGRAAYRLAEIYGFDGFPPIQIAELYEEASHYVSDTWLGSLCTINAAREYTHSENTDKAFELFQSLSTPILNFAFDFQAYYYQSFANLLINRHSFDEALAQIQLAMKSAVKSQDIDLISEVRLMRAAIYRVLKRPEESIEDIKNAEEEAQTIGNIHRAYAARADLGHVAVIAGYPKIARGAWSRFLENQPNLEQSYYRLLLKVNRLDNDTEVEAAKSAWKIIVNIAEERRQTQFLLYGLFKFLWNKGIYDFIPMAQLSTWSNRIELIAEWAIARETLAMLSLVKVRAALIEGSYDLALDMLNRWYLLALEEVGQQILVTAVLLKASCLILNNKENEADTLLYHQLHVSNFVPLAIEYLWAHGKKANSLEAIPIPERSLLKYIIARIGGTGSVYNLVDLFTNFKAGKHVEEFLSRSSEQMHSQI